MQGTGLHILHNLPNVVCFQAVGMKITQTEVRGDSNRVSLRTQHRFWDTRSNAVQAIWDNSEPCLGVYVLTKECN